MPEAVAVNNMTDFTSDLITRHGFICHGEQNMQRLLVPEELGNGSFEIRRVSADIDVGIINLELKRPIISYYDDYPCTYETTYCLSGSISYVETGVMKGSIGKNEMGIYLHPHSRGMTIYPSDQKIVAVSLVANNRFHEQLPHRGELKDLGEPGVKTLIEQLMQPKKVSTRVHNYFSQVVGDNIDDTLLDGYLDGLGKTLLSILWQENVLLPLRGVKSENINEYELKALAQARGILIDRYVSPPSTVDLAKMVTLNEYKLKTGFRKVYGMSIFECVRKIRMEKAKSLLENPEITISEIANRVGYVNTSHFARAFRNECGLNPSDFRF